MGGIVGVWTDSSHDVSEIANLILKAIQHRGPLTQLESLDREKGGAVAVGCVSQDEGTPEIARTRATLTGLDGSFYGRESRMKARHLLRRTNALSAREAVREVAREIGGFAGLVGRGGRLWAFRDVNGLKPLYYLHTSHLAAFASERKGLWRVGLNDPRTVPAGSSVSLTRGRILITPIIQFRRPREIKIPFQRASDTVYRLLSASIRRITRSAAKTCVAFSGGLDSAVAAMLSRKSGIGIEAICIGLAGSPEVLTAEKYARQLGLPITIETFAEDSVETYVRRVLWLIEEPNLMKVSVAIPLHWAAMVAARRGYKVMLCGQGSDELFGGYKKYAITLKLRGRRALSRQLYRSVIDSSAVNYQRDDQATSPFLVELRTPFADPDLIRFSLTIPSEFKVRDGDDVTRKWVLRDVAKNVGLPEDIVWRRKKAIQHGTGVEKAIIKLARTYGATPEEYLAKMFQSVKLMESIP